MAGYGGNLVVLLPNGLSAFRFADAYNFDVESMVLAGEALRLFPCPAGSEERQPPRQRQPFTASELRTEFPDNTFHTGLVHIFSAAGGVLYGRAKDDIDVGTWRLPQTGIIAVSGTSGMASANAATRCSGRARRSNCTYQDPWGKLVLRRVPGNPEGY